MVPVLTPIVPSGTREPAAAAAVDAERAERVLAAETALVERARDGDREAYGALVRRYQDVAYRTAYVIVGGTGEAEDVAQEAFVKAYLALGGFRPGAPFRPWLLRIVANEARNRRRAAGRRAALALRVERDRPSGDAAPSPEAAVLADERRQALLAAVDRLRDDDRRIIACRFFLELTEAETADALAIPRGTVKSRLSRAMARLRDGLAGGAAPGDAPGSAESPTDTPTGPGAAADTGGRDA